MYVCLFVSTLYIPNLELELSFFQVAFSLVQIEHGRILVGFYICMSVWLSAHSTSQIWSKNSQFFSYNILIGQNRARPNFNKIVVFYIAMTILAS